MSDGEILSFNWFVQGLRELYLNKIYDKIPAASPMVSYIKKL
jgi:hypothetical protein